MEGQICTRSRLMVTSGREGGLRKAGRALARWKRSAVPLPASGLLSDSCQDFLTVVNCSTWNRMNTTAVKSS